MSALSAAPQGRLDEAERSIAECRAILAEEETTYVMYINEFDASPRFRGASARTRASARIGHGRPSGPAGRSCSSGT
jgi:hypothetical protein